MKVLVCGGRDYLDYKKVESVLDSQYRAAPLNKENPYYHDLIIIQGGATGADFLAKAWSYCKPVPCEEYKAEWKLYGNSAGYRRNTQMLVEGKPDLVIAFPGGRGTANMVKLAKEAGVEVHVVEI